MLEQILITLFVDTNLLLIFNIFSSVRSITLFFYLTSYKRFLWWSLLPYYKFFDVIGIRVSNLMKFFVIKHCLETFISLIFQFIRHRRTVYLRFIWNILQSIFQSNIILKRLLLIFMHTAWLFDRSFVLLDSTQENNLPL